VKKKKEIKSTQCEKLDLFSLGVVMYFLLFNRHPFNYRNNMTITEYTKKMDETVLNYEGNKITTCCKSFLEGLLEKNINKRLSFEQAISHPWLVLIREKTEDYLTKYQSDPDKMIAEMNKCQLEDSFFAGNKTYVSLDISKEEAKVDPDNFMNKKRKRSKDKKM